MPVERQLLPTIHDVLAQSQEVPTSAGPLLEPFIAGRVDDKLITAHWNNVLRLAASVRTGT